ncbi:hypothetical protein FAM15346_002064 [Propionibacterium freudenreichii]|uniref:hypothetical protein n=1 Tax=Propionibacterium freudenreichii TaxID=1744 RepID=UPI0005419650|nr:hypothetical protein [Propionibacterium freudenreichii]MCT3003757.1 hypothetical protein [Propionibacterium freudenreichii]MDK9644986.1 hypothetical protein [Propionibacterium freudenreichii]CEG86325.1 Putative uncharacterized protein [Propionibacterium freudenreichii]CEI24533.1 Putative uncharacterized protein [Propionibacterium freudenreichii]
MNLTGPRRSGPNDEETTAPVELPHVLVTVAEDGTLAGTVDGAPFPSPDAGAWTRATFGPLMDAITQNRTIAVRVEVRENDGSVFTDILRTRKPRRAVAPSEIPVPETRRSRHARRVPRLAEVTAGGFVPGEDIAVATIVSHTDATGTGEARALIDLDDLPDGSTHEVILLGRISGTLAVRRLT